ncbi:MAG TPA: bifunctional diaminohydroxyphosphoribosylaminopyrimidine deaminase/5-amino-6-(5-phosphoribosylamino)uracil reductase RibD, partial [Plasticicumulans sp.]|uniref:bifunctional diaminohydroxyphosphoribosylaminopyrimidine deaminase/5-amino-6-(5-phosphoribosylamino)uracil reductase RibD n=1 Tax=Plasticicumulans sp. TaxID=2307179 RepID=UPI002C68B182
MARALALAARGLNTTSPNPRVGCVLVAPDGEVIGEGWHERAGEPHAEVHALRAAGGRARGATAYVTLEPCSHHGRTPPCADALIEAGVARVVAAMADPNPQVAGRGLARLRAAGIAVECGLLEAEALALNAGFVQRMTRARPWLRLKLAASLDARTALASGESQWITGEAARTDVQRLRARACAVLTGSGTVLADDPGLDVRL